MRILQFSLGQLQANCYFLIKENQCLIIDPADEASFILEELQRRNLNLVGMLATHGHFDHVMAAGEIQKSFSIPLYIFKDDLFLVKNLNQSAQRWLGYNPSSLQPGNIKFLEDKMLSVSSFVFRVIHTPGHTPGSCCFYFSKENLIFTGDTLFKDGIGRYDFSYSDKKELKKSLEKILKLDAETIIYPGHGEKTVVGREKKILDKFYL